MFVWGYKRLANLWWGTVHWKIPICRYEKCKIFQWKKPGSEQNWYFSPKKSQWETRTWHIYLSHVEEPGSSPSRNLNLGFLHSGGCLGNGAGLDHVSMGFKTFRLFCFSFQGNLRILWGLWNFPGQIKLFLWNHFSAVHVFKNFQETG